MKRVLEYSDKPSSVLGVAQVREPDDDEPDRITVQANGISIDVVANEDGTVYVEAYPYRQNEAVMAIHVNVDIYKTKHPNLYLKRVFTSLTDAQNAAGKA